MAKRTPAQIAEQARARIDQIRRTLVEFDSLCSGTLQVRMKTCGKEGCRCAADPDARHGPYYEWGHMQGGKQVHRLVSAQQAEILRRSIANYRAVKKLLKAWEVESERLIDVSSIDRT